MHVVFRLVFVIHKTASLEIIFQEAKEMEVRGAQSGLKREWGRTFHFSVVIGPLCTDWCVVCIILQKEDLIYLPVWQNPLNSLF